MRRMQPSLSLPLSLCLSAKARPPPSKFKHATPSLRVLAHTQRIAEGAYTRDPPAGQRALLDDTACVKGLVDAQRVWPAEWPVCWWLNSVWIYARPLSDPCNHRRARSRRAPLSIHVSVATASTSLESTFQIQHASSRSTCLEFYRQILFT